MRSGRKKIIMDDSTTDYLCASAIQTNCRHIRISITYETFIIFFSVFSNSFARSQITRLMPTQDKAKNNITYRVNRYNREKNTYSSAYS